MLPSVSAGHSDSPGPERFVVQGTKAGFQSALWICVAIGVAALATSIILKPRPLVTAPDSTPQLTH